MILMRHSGCPEWGWIVHVSTSWQRGAAMPSMTLTRPPKVRHDPEGSCAGMGSSPSAHLAGTAARQPSAVVVIGHQSPRPQR